MSDPFGREGGDRSYYAFKEPGDTAVGIVHEIDNTFPDRDYATDEQKLDKWGKPATLTRLDLTDPTTGEPFNVVLRGHMYTAVREAWQSAGIDTPTMHGALLRLKFDKLGEPKKAGYHPPKLFKAKIEPAPANAAPRKAAETSTDPFGGFDDEEPF